MATATKTHPKANKAVHKARIENAKHNIQDAQQKNTEALSSLDECLADLMASDADEDNN
jgi:hypothetical protein